MNVVVLGASNNPERYAYTCTHLLLKAGHQVIPVGIKKGHLEGLLIVNSHDPIKDKDIDIITIYMNSTHQRDWYDFILHTHPRKLIFNPGAENNELKKLAEFEGIETFEDCTIVMLKSDQL